MAKGNWRNWDEIECAGGCGNRIYEKYGKKQGGKVYCPKCFERIKKNNTGSGWHEQADHTGKAPEHSSVARATQPKDALRAPMNRNIFYAGRQERKPQGKFIYVSESKEYAKNFGEHIMGYKINPNNTFDLTSFKEQAISFDRLNAYLKRNGIIINKSTITSIFNDRLIEDEVYKPAWQWIRKYPEIAIIIKSRGFDSIKQLETFTGKGKPILTIQILDNSILKEIA